MFSAASTDISRDGDERWSLRLVVALLREQREIFSSQAAADAFSGRVRGELKMEVHLPRYRERVSLV